MVQLEQQHDVCKDDLNNALTSKSAGREALKSSMAEKERNLRKSESEAEELFKVFHADLFVDCPLKMLMSQVTIQCQIFRQFNCALYVCVLCSNLQTIHLCFVCVYALQQWESKYQMGIESCKLDLAAKKSEWADMVTMILNTKQKTDTLLESLAKFAAQSVESVKQQLCP
jgi:hypothetical protein